MELNQDQLEARRAFLAKAGKFAVITPAVVTGLLTVSKGNYAMAISGSARHANNGFGNGGGDGIPGKSGGKGKGGHSDHGR